MPFTPVVAPKCPLCKTSVYQAEQVICSDRKPYHKACLKCVNCAIRLTPATLNEHDEKLFCNVCYERYFNPVEFTVDYYGGIVTPEDIEREKERERLEKERLEAALRDKRCPTCSQKVYPEQAVEFSDVIFHKTCVKCCECMRSFDGKDMCMGPKEDPRPFCKFCFAKAFGISALDITELVQIAPSNQIATQGLWAKMIQEQWRELMKIFILKEEKLWKLNCLDQAWHVRSHHVCWLGYLHKILNLKKI